MAGSADALTPGGDSATREPVAARRANARRSAERGWARLPVIVTTGYAQATVGEPDVDVLAKPFSETALVEQVRHRIGDA